MDLAFSHLVAVYRYLDNSSTMCVRRRSGCTLNAWELDTNTHILQNKNIVCLQYHTTPPPHKYVNLSVNCMHCCEKSSLFWFGYQIEIEF